MALDRALGRSTMWQRKEWRHEGVLARGECGGDAQARQCEELSVGCCGCDG